MSPQSKYCYPGTEVLINIPGIKDQEALTRFENIVATTRNTQLGETPVNGKFDLEHLKNIHFFLFQDVYSFAGEIRSEGKYLERWISIRQNRVHHSPSTSNIRKLAQ